MSTFLNIQEKLFKESTPKRIVIKLDTRSLDAGDYRRSTYNIVSEIFPLWETDSRILFLAVDVWSERTFLVIDIHNDNYDFSTAHKSMPVFPVYILRQHRTRAGWALQRFPPEDNKLATRLEDLHNVNGFDVPIPYLEDHTSKIVHANPREFASS